MKFAPLQYTAQHFRLQFRTILYGMYDFVLFAHQSFMFVVVLRS